MASDALSGGVQEGILGTDKFSSGPIKNLEKSYVKKSDASEQEVREWCLDILNEVQGLADYETIQEIGAAFARWFISAPGRVEGFYGYFRSADLSTASVSRGGQAEAAAMRFESTHPNSSAPIVDAEEIEPDDFVERLRRHMERQKTAGGELASFESDSLGGVVLEARIQLEKNRNNGEFSARLCAGPLVESLKRILDNERVSLETLVDLVVALFAGESVYSSGRNAPKGTPEFQRLISALYEADKSFIEEKEKVERVDAGNLSTAANLMTWLGATRERSCKRQACGIGLYVLGKAVLLGVASSTSRVLHQVANNLAGWLDDFIPGQDDPTLTPEEWVKMAQGLSAIHAIATTAHLIQREEAGVVNSERHQAVVSLLKLEVEALNVALGSVEALRFMVNIPNAWRSLCAPLESVWGKAVQRRSDEFERNYLSAVLSVAAAVVRIRLDDLSEADDAIGTLFNVGVDSLRFGRKLQKSKHVVVKIRLATNGLGLWWAVRNGQNWSDAFLRLHGSDCTVNFLGAATEIKGLAKDNADLKAICSNLLGFLKPEDRVRASASCKEIFGEEIEVRSSLTAAALGGMLVRVLVGLVPEVAEQWAILGRLGGQGQDYRNEFSEIVFQVLETLFLQEEREGGREGDYFLVKKGFFALAAKIAEMSESPGEWYKKLFEAVPKSLDGWEGKNFADVQKSPEESWHDYILDMLGDLGFMQKIFVG